MAAEFDQAISMSARLMAANLRRQAPVDTGALRRSIKVQGRMTGDRINFSITYLAYGKFTDMGTGRYHTRTRRSWNPRPGRGRGGIKPRFWLTLERAVYENLQRRIAKATGKFIIIGLNRSI